MNEQFTFSNFIGQFLAIFIPKTQNSSPFWYYSNDHHHNEPDWLVRLKKQFITTGPHKCPCSCQRWPTEGFQAVRHKMKKDGIISNIVQLASRKEHFAWMSGRYRNNLFWTWFQLGFIPVYLTTDTQELYCMIEFPSRKVGKHPFWSFLQYGIALWYSILSLIRVITQQWIGRTGTVLTNRSEERRGGKEC